MEMHNHRAVMMFIYLFSVLYICCCCFLLHQDQLSADMYSFVAKEIDYASYFQTVSRLRPSCEPHKCSAGPSQTLRSLLCAADRSPGRIPPEVVRAASERVATDQSSSGWVSFTPPDFYLSPFDSSTPIVLIWTVWGPSVGILLI